MNKVVVLGFDGLDPFIIEKFIDRLPNIKHLIQEGFFVKLQSTIPPITSAAWTCTTSGLVYDYAAGGIAQTYTYTPADGTFQCSAGDC